MKKYAIIAALIAISACAPTPSSIQPVAPPASFADVSCREVGAMLKTEREALAVIVAEQEKTARNDGISAAIIGVPVSKLNGTDKAPEIAARKGRVQALEAREADCT